MRLHPWHEPQKIHAGCFTGNFDLRNSRPCRHFLFVWKSRHYPKLLAELHQVITATLEIDILAHERLPLLQRRLPRQVSRSPKIDSLAADKEEGLSAFIARAHYSVELFQAEAHDGLVQPLSDDRAMASKTSGRLVILPFDPSAKPYRRW